MSHRTFIDSDGVEWEVWDVIPRGIAHDAPERRSGPDRRSGNGGGYAGEERRSLAERRILHVAPAMRAGWLAFQCAHAKRRLVPIPPGWADEPPDRLEEYCRLARDVVRVER